MRIYFWCSGLWVPLYISHVRNGREVGFDEVGVVVDFDELVFCGCGGVAALQSVSDGAGIHTQGFFFFFFCSRFSVSVQNG